MGAPLDQGLCVMEVSHDEVGGGLGTVKSESPSRRRLFASIPNLLPCPKSEGDRLEKKDYQGPPQGVFLDDSDFFE